MIKSLIIILLSYLVPKISQSTPSESFKKIRLQLLLCSGKSSQCYGPSKMSVLWKDTLSANEISLFKNHKLKAAVS